MPLQKPLPWAKAEAKFNLRVNIPMLSFEIIHFSITALVNMR